MKIQNLFAKGNAGPVDTRCIQCGLDTQCLSPRMEVSGKGQKSILIIGEAPGCVSGNTLIETAFRDKSVHPNGIPIKDLVGKKDFFVYSYDTKTDKMVLGKVKKVWKVGVKKVWKVTYTWKFCKGRKVITKQNFIEVTSNHPFLIKKAIPNDPFKGIECNHTYLSLDQGLSIGYSLQPFHRSNKYYSYIGSFSKCMVKESRFLLEFKLKRNLLPLEESHHKDKNKLNDSLKNLDCLTKQQHSRHHCLAGDTRNSKKGLEKLRKVLRSQSYRDKMSTVMKEKLKTNPKLLEQRIAQVLEVGKATRFKKGRTNPMKGKQVGPLAYYNYLLGRMKMFNWGKEEIKKKFLGKFPTEEFPPIDNHKITNIKYIGLHSVYDMEVEEYHNFAANGIFVHNSEEDRKATQWVGKAGQFLRKALNNCDIDLNRDCWKTNAVCCRPTNGNENRKPTKKEIDFCRYRVLEIIEKYKPKYIMLFGGVAVASVLGHLHPKLEISKVHGYKIPVQEYKAWVLPIYHPSYIMRNERDLNLLSVFNRDLYWASLFFHKEKNRPPHYDYISNLEDVHLLTNLSDVRAAFQKILKTKEPTAFDYESTGTKPFLTGHKITSMAIATELGSYAFPVDYQRHWDDIELDSIYDLITEYLSDDEIYKVAHNARFEKMWSEELLDVRPKVDWCTMDAQHLLDHRSGITGLKFQAFIRWGIQEYDKFAKKYIKSEKGVSFNKMDKMPLGDQLLYVGLDAKLTRKLYLEQKPHFHGKLEDGRKLFRDTSDVFLDMQMNGLSVNEDHYISADKDLTIKIDEITARLAKAPEILKYRTIYGRDFKESSPKDLQELLFDQMKIISLKKTTGGDRSVDASVLSDIVHPIPKDILLKRKYVKIRDSYLAQFLRECTDGYMHPNFNLNIARSLRSCLAKGTKILAVRDFEKHPEGVPIEEIKNGDYVYCFDDNLNPTIQKVLWAGKTGHRKTIRIHYQAHHKRMFIDCTPEHRIRMIDGSYIEAQNIMRNTKQRNPKGPLHHALAGARHGDEVYFTGHLKHSHGIKEHRLIYSELIGFLQKDTVVHHENENHLDHTPSNLEAMTKSEHSFLHTKKRMNQPETKVRLSTLMKNRWASGELKKHIRRGKEHSNYLGLTKWNCLRLLAEVDGKIKHLVGEFYIDTATFQKYLDEHKIDRKLVKLRYDKNGKYISKGRLIKLSKLGRAKVSKILGHNYYKLLDLYEFYGIDTKRMWGNQSGPFIPGNHAITKIENLERTEDVYDIEVENYHNFFANELCVHNSATNPSFQNIPKRDEEARTICRKGIVPSKGCVLLEGDFGGIEVCTSALYHKDPVFINYLVSDDADMHRDGTLQLWKIPKNQITKMLRFYTKNCWTFPQFYGDYYASCAESLWKACVEGKLKLADGTLLIKHLQKVGLGTLKQFTEHCRVVEHWLWHKQFQVYTEWKDDINESYQKNGFVETFFGFRFTDYLDKKQATNYPIQSTATHLLFWSLIQVTKKLREQGLKSVLVGQIHDSMILDVPGGEIEQVVSIIRQVCETDLKENFKWITVPMSVDLEISKLHEDGGNLAEMEEYKN